MNDTPGDLDRDLVGFRDHPGIPHDGDVSQLVGERRLSTSPRVLDRCRWRR